MHSERWVVRWGSACRARAIARAVVALEPLPAIQVRADVPPGAVGLAELNDGHNWYVRAPHGCRSLRQLWPQTNLSVWRIYDV